MHASSSSRNSTQPRKPDDITRGVSIASHPTGSCIPQLPTADPNGAANSASKAPALFEPERFQDSPSLSPLIEKPTPPLPTPVPALTTLYSLQSSESRHHRRRRTCAVSASTSSSAAQRLGNATELVPSRGVAHAGGVSARGQAARGARFGGFEAFFDGEELGFESITLVSTVSRITTATLDRGG